MSNLLEGRDQIVILPTGAGKSLCFQLASQLLEGVTLVAVPLLALLDDQLRQCRKAGLRVGALRGGQSASERRKLAAKLAAGEVRLVYATPEALIHERTAELFGAVAVAALVVDEAHCIAEWGPSFRPAYLSLGSVAQRLGAATRAAFTATAGAAVLGAIRHGLFGDRPVSVVAGEPDRPNLRYRVLSSLCKDRSLEQLVRGSPRPAVVFCRTRAGAEASARMLRRRLGDERIRFYHAGLDAGERRAVERWFLSSPDGVLTATSAYGMGVDKGDIRTVVHRDLPPSPEAYLQEVGRAGRDGAAVQATLLSSVEDGLYAAGLSDPVERRRAAQMLRYSRESQRCRRETLFGFLGHAISACAGCDVCDGSSATPEAQAEGLGQIRGAIERHSRRLTLRQLTLLLAGGTVPEVWTRGLDRMAGFGALSGWEPEDIEDALETLRRRGELRVPSRGPWRGRIVAAGIRDREPDQLG